MLVLRTYLLAPIGHCTSVMSGQRFQAGKPGFQTPQYPCAFPSILASKAAPILGDGFLANSWRTADYGRKPAAAAEFNIFDDGLGGLAQRRFIAKNCHGPP
jgi:hypothetical protein